MKLLGEITLFIVACILFCIVAPIAFIYAIRPRKNWVKLITLYLRKVSYSIDQHGNAIARFLFNDILIKDNTLSFGKPDETISSVLGKNKIKNNLTELGIWLDSILDKIDPNHSINSIEHNEY